MNKKGQVVMEVMVVISVLVIGMVLFGLFYLNKHPVAFEQANIISSEEMVSSPVTYSEVTAPSRIVCGNYICDPGESSSDCPNDCHCGNGACQPEFSETCNNCPGDCGSCVIETLCGNGSIDVDEECDGTNLNGGTCSSKGFTAGSLSCYPNCTFNISGCYNLPVCNNGIVEGEEQCDLSDLNSNTCASLGYDYGALYCNNDCSYNTTECKFYPGNTCLSFDSGGWRRYNTTNPNWFTRGNMATWPDHDAIWLCPTSTCQYITDYYFLYNSFLLLEDTEITLSALGDDETKVWLWPNNNLENEIEVIPQHVWITGWTSNTLDLTAGTYSVVQLIYDTNQSATGAILSIKNENTGEVILNTALDKGWHYYRTMNRFEEERFSSENGCTSVYSNQFCGDDIIEGNEQCEGSDLGDYSGKTCSDINSSWDIGSLSCHPNYCQIDTSDCKPAPVPICDGGISRGDGSPENPKEICNAGNLDEVDDHLDWYYILGVDIDLDVPPYNSGNGWPPIGYISNSSRPQYHEFTGNFNGNGHTIYNLYIQTPDSWDYHGLFSALGPGAVISNLHLVNVNLNGLQKYSGSLVGRNNGGTVNNCSATNVEIVAHKEHIGGLVGYLENNGVISNSYATGNISSSKDYIGGLVGYSSSGQIHDNYFKGYVFSSKKNLGGLIGKAVNSQILNNYVAARVSGGSGNMGCFMGSTTGCTITSNYYNTTTCTIVSAPILGVLGKPTADLKIQSTFIGWDFINTWNINSTNEGYPHLITNPSN